MSSTSPDGEVVSPELVEFAPSQPPLYVGKSKRLYRLPGELEIVPTQVPESAHAGMERLQRL